MKTRSPWKGLYARMQLEQMEDRRVPAFYAVTGPDDTSGLTPTAGDGSQADPYQVASLRSAVEQAMATAADDVITLSAGAYILDNPDLLDLDVGDAAAAGALTVTGAGEASTSVLAGFGSGPADGRIFSLAAGARLTLNNLTLAGGDAGMGGAILAYGGGAGTDLTLANVTLSGNQASEFGGAIAGVAFGQSLTVTLTNTTVTGNGASYGGGLALLYGGVVSIDRSTISGNNADTASGVGGGIAVLADYGGTLAITNSTISGNAAAFGGGVATFFDQGGATTLTNTTVSGNTATQLGGGGLLAYGNAPTAPLALVNSTVSGNTTAGYGGGVLGVSSGDVTLTNSTVTANQGYGGGLATYFGSNTFTVRNTIVAGNLDPAGTTPSDLAATSGTPFVATYSLIGVGDGGVINADGSANNLTGTALNPLDPRLGPLAANGGPTLTHAPLADSSAVGAGDPDVSGLPATDQRGGPRLSGSRVDIGAVEAQAITISQTTLPAATVGAAYSEALLASGPEGTYTYTVTAGALPPGLALSPAGVLSGTPTADGTFTFTVGVTDGAGAAGSRTFTFTVNPAAATPTGPTVPLVGRPQTIAGGSNGTVTVLNPDGSAAATLTPFPGYTGEVRAAAGANGQVVGGTGPGVTNRVAVVDPATRAVVFSLSPYETSFAGGVFVATGDIYGTGTPDVIVTPDQGGSSRVVILDGVTGAVKASFLGIDDPNFRGGARAATADVNGDGVVDLLVAAGFGGGPRVTVYDGASLRAGTLTVVANVFVFEPTLRNGVYVTGGDVNGDGYADLVVGGGPGGGPRVFALSGLDLTTGSGPPAVLANFFAGDPSNRDGVRVAAKNLDGDRFADLVVGPGPSGGTRVTAYAGATITPSGTPPVLFGYDDPTAFDNGVYVG